MINKAPIQFIDHTSCGRESSENYNNTSYIPN